MVIIVLGLITLIRATEMNYHILVFDDRFIIRYSNFLGKMMTVDSVFYFKEVIKFDFHIHNQTQNAGQTLVVSIATKLRTNRYNRSKNEMPLAEINIEYLDDLRESKIKKFSFHYSGRSYEKAFKLIKSKI